MNELYLSLLFCAVLMVAFYWFNRPRGIIKPSAIKGLYYFHFGPYSYAFQEVHWSEKQNEIYFVNGETITGKIRLGMQRGANVVNYVERVTGLEVYFV
jgi:hypothetical protein